MIDIQVYADDLIQNLLVLENKLGTVEESIWDSVADILLKSVTENFIQSGRPTRWLPSQKIAKRGGKTLIESGALMASGLVSDMTENSVSVSWGAGLDYALIHQFGGVIKHPYARVRGSKKKKEPVEGGEYDIVIPARPYVMFQPEDIRSITGLFQQYYSTQPS